MCSFAHRQSTNPRHSVTYTWMHYCCWHLGGIHIVYVTICRLLIILTHIGYEYIHSSLGLVDGVERLRRWAANNNRTCNICDHNGRDQHVMQYGKWGAMRSMSRMRVNQFSQVFDIQMQAHTHTRSTDARTHTNVIQWSAPKRRA